MTDKASRQLHKDTLDVYFAVLKSVATPGMGALRVISPHDDDSLLEGIGPRVRASVPKANIFEMDPALMQDVYVAFTKQIGDAVAEEMNRRGVSRIEDLDDDTVTNLMRGELDRPECDLPDRLPFPCMYFGYGLGVHLEDSLLDIMFPLLRREEAAYDFRITGHLITAQRDVLTFAIGAHRSPALALTMDQPENKIVSLIERATGGEWRNPSSLAGFVVPWLINYVNSHRDLIVGHTGSFAYRSRYKAQAKKLKVTQSIPPPYYVVKLKAPDIKFESRKRGPSTTETEWTCRRKRRGHQRCKILRGPLPLDPKDEVAIRKRWERAKGQFEIFTHGELSQRAIDALGTRGLWLKRPDEWMAILYTWVDDCIWPKDRTDLPLVESVRQPTRSVRRLGARKKGSA